jgi:hypothetical protein
MMHVPDDEGDSHEDADDETAGQRTAKTGNRDSVRRRRVRSLCTGVHIIYAYTSACTTAQRNNVGQAECGAVNTEQYTACAISRVGVQCVCLCHSRFLLFSAHTQLALVREQYELLRSQIRPLRPNAETLEQLRRVQAELHTEKKRQTEELDNRREQLAAYERELIEKAELLSTHEVDIADKWKAFMEVRAGQLQLQLYHL